jgi:hydroxymethylpyrimidine/phosphomethylpyrimidine kinase
VVPVALTIAGSDPSGGAGIQADLKTFHQFGVYGEAVITLITVQNTTEVSRVELLPPDLIVQQLAAVLADIPPHAAKTGAMGTAECVKGVAALSRAFAFPLVVDPVMISKHGSRLLAPDAEAALREELIPRATLVTPNIAEAELLAQMTIRDAADAERAAEVIGSLGATAVLVKGGHLEGTPVDVLWFAGSVRHFQGTRIETRHTHGTGCTYSAAITALLAKGASVPDAVDGAKKYIQRAIETSPGLGSGAGPTNHFADVSGASS